MLNYSEMQIRKFSTKFFFFLENFKLNFLWTHFTWLIWREKIRNLEKLMLIQYQYEYHGPNLNPTQMNVSKLEHTFYTCLLGSRLSLRLSVLLSFPSSSSLSFDLNRKPLGFFWNSPRFTNNSILFTLSRR